MLNLFPFLGAKSCTLRGWQQSGHAGPGTGGTWVAPLCHKAVSSAPQLWGLNQPLLASPGKTV